MEFKGAIWGLLIFSMIIVAASVIINENATMYGSGISSDLEQDFNKLDDLSNTAESQKGKISPQSGEANSDFETGTFKGVYAIITNIFEPFRMIFGDNGMIDAITERFGIPNYVRITIVTGLIFSIIFGLVAIIFRLGKS